jgi:hypothetical protein
MLTRFLATSCLLAAILCGCSSEHFKTGHGDAGRFILDTAIARGGHPVATNNLPTLGGRWQYSTDQYGVVIKLPPDQYPNVEALLANSFGKPKFAPTKGTDGSMFFFYRLSSKGGAIQVFGQTNYTQVIIIRPMPMSDLMQALQTGLTN